MESPLQYYVLGLALLCAASLQAFAEDPPAAPADPGEALVNLLERLQADPATLNQVKEALIKDIEAQKAAAPDAEAAENAARIAELESQVRLLAEQTAAAQKELDDLKAKVAAAPAFAPRRLEVLEQSLRVIEAIAPSEPAATPTPTPAESVVEAAPAVSSPPSTDFSTEQIQFFEKRVLSILSERCFKCHGETDPKSGLRLDSLAGMLQGGKRGPAIVQGKPEESLLIKALHQEGDLKMPAEGPQLDPAQIETLSTWIKVGAPWPGPATSTPPSPAPAVPEPVPAPTAVAVAPAVAPSGPDAIDFNRQIRPLLSEYCYACHGPDANKRKGGLRIDDGVGGYQSLPSGETAIVPGDLATSELYRRLTTDDADDRMPPAEAQKHPKPEHIDLLRRWIEQGARWEKHWSFVPPQRSALPAVAKPDWPRNDIDRFILQKVEGEGFEPAPEAEREKLIRRLTFDLTGLPPAIDEVDAFVDDASSDAYAKVVDRLLTSPRYGEHMARQWLDLARYADTNGYHIDNERQMWRWRDWVIDAFNTNMPFNRFSVEQLAGDLIPDAGTSEKLASGFNRNHMINFEGGAIPEEYRTQYVIDRLTATSTVWMGLTVGCAQCHDHKFDPISQREFYQMFAFFNTIPEQGLDGQGGNSAPLMKAPLPEQTAQLDSLRAELELLRADRDKPMPEVDAAQATWEAQWAVSQKDRWIVLEPTTFTPTVEGENKGVYEILASASMPGIQAIRLDALAHAPLPSEAARTEFSLREFELDVASTKTPETFERVKLTLVNTDRLQQDAVESAKAIDGNADSAWPISDFHAGKNRTAIFVPERPIGGPEGSLIRIRMRHNSGDAYPSYGSFRFSVTADPQMRPATFDGWYYSGHYAADSGDAAYQAAYPPEAGIDLEAKAADGRATWVQLRGAFPDGQINPLSGEVGASYLYREIDSPSARAMTITIGSNDAVKIWLNDRVVHDNNVARGVKADEDIVRVQLDAGKNRLLAKVVNYGNDYAFFFRNAYEQVGAVPLNIELALEGPAEARSPESVATVRDFFRRFESAEWRDIDKAHAAKETELKAYDDAIPTAMVMAEMDQPRETFMLNRGQYDQFGDKVEAATPAVMPPLPAGAKANRLGLAQWLVDPANPLTARVTVNRFWQRFFGTGIVKTSEDFGVQGEWPSHPELLDWLAVEFMESGWDVKHLVRLMVTSATYRQSSRLTPELTERDPNNRLLARGPRYRFDAEIVRDNALAVSGLLVEHVGGPSVKPYQPAGLWEEVAFGGGFTAQVFAQDKGEANYRRSMYTFWKRQAPPPNMMLFDAPNREVCTSQRARTNTPLQALALLNDPQFVEASRAFGERIMKQGGGTPEDRVNFAFRAVTSRWPTDPERAILLDMYQQQWTEYQANPDSAVQLLSIGEAPRDPTLDTCELAAWSIVANAILNLDEAYTKG